MEEIISLWSGPAGAYLTCWDQFWAPQFNSNLGKPEAIKSQATEMVVVQKAWKERLRELGLFCPKKAKGGV